MRRVGKRLSGAKLRVAKRPRTESENWVWLAGGGGQDTEQGGEREAVRRAPLVRCSLTRRSSGSSNGVPPGPEARYGVHFLSSGPGVTPSLSPLAPTLGSTFRHCGLHASQFKCSFRRPLLQYRSRCLPFFGSSQCRGQANHACRHHRSAHVLRRSRVPPSLCPHPKPDYILPLAIDVPANSSQSAQVIWSRLRASQRKAVSHEVGFGGLFRLFAWCSKSRAVVGARQAKFWWQSVVFPVQLRNATKDRSAA
jgi:hypothetical protein